MHVSSEESGLTFENARVAPVPLNRVESKAHYLGPPQRPDCGMVLKLSTSMIGIRSSQNIGHSPQARFTYRELTPEMCRSVKDKRSKQKMGS